MSLSNTAPRYFLLLPAAGSGQRMVSERPKQYLAIHGRSLLQHTLERLGSMGCFDRIVLVLAAQDRWWSTVRQQLPVTVQQKLVLATGGSQRADSVVSGLQALATIAQPHDWVLVHDVVRPCVSLSDVEKLIEAVKDAVAGGLLASPLRETLKRGTAAGTVEQTLDRRNLWCAATPQMFRYEVLLQSLLQMAAAGRTVTDEAEAVEACGYPVQLIPGRADNLKVTYPEDLELAALLLGPGA
jgi:2-C-methyl-D-erythritol 4-phosphate cytidylyltransferase